MTGETGDSFEVLMLWWGRVYVLRRRSIGQWVSRLDVGGEQRDGRWYRWDARWTWCTRE